MVEQFVLHLQHYIIDIIPALLLGFLISGIVHEFLPESFAEKYLNNKGILPILYVTLIGTILPICCFGSLPIAISFRKKGMPLGPVLAFLVATPATSITAIFVTWQLFGLGYTVYLCITVILMGLIMGMIGNLLTYPESSGKPGECPMCSEGKHEGHCHHGKKFSERIKSVLCFGFIDLPKEMGLELAIGIILAAIVASVSPIELLIKNYLIGWYGYVFALLFGLLMYICSTASVPLVHAFVSQGLSIGAGLVLLLVGPITSYGTILVVKKEFGLKVLITYLIVISVISVISGLLFTILF